MNEKPNLQQYPAAKAAFEKWYMEKHQPDFPINPHTLSYWLGQFYVMHFDFQAGVFCAFLRDRGLYFWMTPDGTKWNADIISPNRHLLWTMEGFGTDYDTALLAAIEAGFAVVEKGLTEAGNTRQKEQK